MSKKSLYINGKWVNGNGSSFVSQNPATGAVLWEKAGADKRDIDRAIKAARKSFPFWSTLPFTKRKKYLEGFVRCVKRERNTFAETISKETGKPLWESFSEVDSMTNKLAVSLRAYDERCREVQKEAGSAVSWRRFKPHGVVAVYGPFNFPAHLPNGHMIPALLAGNTVVFKPSEETPLVGESLIEVWDKAGLPAGVINCVQGGKDAGINLSAHPGLNGLYFTGSAETGKQIHRSFAGHPEKILALEMGGNNPLIVFEVKSIDAAAYLTIQSAYLTSGQRCTCARRLIVLKGKEGDAFINRLLEMSEAIRVGAYTERPEPFMGPLISDKAADDILKWQEKLSKRGGRILMKMEPLKRPAMLKPGLMDVTDVKDRPDIEIFGPFLQVIRVSDFNGAVAEANRTSFGLAAGLLSDNRKLYEKFFRMSRAGVVNFNRQLTGASSDAPFGGVKQSGNHRPAAYFTADYCAYPVASIEEKKLSMPEKKAPGIDL